jgi:hypothetical protein
MRTYRVTLKISDENGNPVVIETKGDTHGFTGADSLTVYAEPSRTVLIVPGGEFAAIEIIFDDEPN